ncbi:hypothetical protein B0H16DRAFT_410897 [Mycena metata]|uniref:Uncharacterized protein n=1 Tax=Mycena metata TaxID=1033252 RepID=A0AAD7HFW2_9AGAR|nr:hypothetical protein B0H16DRAFT_410897 [Mycena metata]
MHARCACPSDSCARTRRPEVDAAKEGWGRWMRPPAYRPSLRPRTLSLHVSYLRASTPRTASPAPRRCDIRKLDAAPSLGCTCRNLTPEGEVGGVADMRLLVGFVRVLLPLISTHGHPSLVCRPRWWCSSHPSPPFFPPRWSTSPEYSDDIANTPYTRLSPRPRRRIPSTSRRPHPQSALTLHASTSPTLLLPRAVRVDLDRVRTYFQRVIHASVDLAHAPFVVSGSCSHANRPSTTTDEAERNGNAMRVRVQMYGLDAKNGRPTGRTGRRKMRRRRSKLGAPAARVWGGRGNDI